IGGWYLSDSPGNLTQFRIPGSVNIAPGGLASVGFVESTLAVTSPTVVYLTKDDGTTVANAVNTALPLDGRSVGRKPAGGGSWFLFTDPTRDAPNASAEELASFLSINEVHYDIQGDIDWVELHNSGSTSISTAGLWLASEREFGDKIPLGTAIPAGGFASWNTGFATGGGDEVLFLIDSTDKVLDAVAIEQRAGRAHSAAFPDGSDEFFASIAGSRDAANNP
ncbi:MAG: lamin tail domain-containing protein, partial [Akkermansiaceae bacterium]|nr:lamin tail domain-containing protein [Akkermansiaceae bacterium]